MSVCAEEVAVLFQACTLGRSDIVKNSIASIKAKPGMTSVMLDPATTTATGSGSGSDGSGDGSGEELYVRLISHCRDEDGLAPLHIATKAGHADVIRSLLVCIFLVPCFFVVQLLVIGTVGNLCCRVLALT
jgi:hypothetical protein